MALLGSFSLWFLADFGWYKCLCAVLQLVGSSVDSCSGTPASVTEYYCNVSQCSVLSAVHKLNQPFEPPLVLVYVDLICRSVMHHVFSFKAQYIQGWWAWIWASGWPRQIRWHLLLIHGEDKCAEGVGHWRGVSQWETGVITVKVQYHNSRKATRVYVCSA